MYDYGTQRIGQVDKQEKVKVPIPKSLLNDIVKFDSNGNASVKLSVSDDKIVVGKSIDGLKTIDADTEVFIEIPIHDLYTSDMKLRCYNVVKTNDHIELRFYTDKCEFCGKDAAINYDGIAYYDRCVCRDCYNRISGIDAETRSETHKCTFCGKEHDTGVLFTGNKYVCKDCHEEIRQTPLTED